MKKIILLTLLFISFTTSAFAEFKLDESRWKWVFSTDKFGCYYDTNTAKIKSVSVFEVWYCNYYPGHTSCGFLPCINVKQDTTEHYHYSRTEFDAERYTAFCKNIIFRDNNGRVFSSYESSEAPQYNKPVPIIPDTVVETVMLKIKQDLYKYRR